MKKIFYFIFMIFILFSCSKKEEVEVKVNNITGNIVETNTGNVVETNTGILEIETSTGENLTNTGILGDESSSGNEIKEEESKKDEEVTKEDKKNEESKKEEDKKEEDKKESEKENKKENCLFDECIPENIKVSKDKYGNTIGEKIENKGKDEEKKYTYKINTNQDYFEVKLQEMMHQETKQIFKVGENYIKSIDNAGCGGSNLDQKVYDKNSKELNNFTFDDIKKEIYIGSVKFQQTLTGTGGYGQPLDSYNAFKVYKDKDGENNIYENEEEFVKFITNKVLKEDKKLYKSYIAQFKNHPGINVIFNSVGYNGNSIRVIFLGTDSNYLTKNIEKSDYGDDYLLDLKVTNKILSYYGNSDSSYNLFDKDGNLVKSIDKSKMPFFVVEKINEEGYYLVYLKEGYRVESIAEMCKPVVYYYGKENEKNSLTLNLKDKDYFTKLIPQLDKNNTWNFEIKNSKIQVENQKYDYLYYSLVTTGYEHNKDGWIVKGEDITNFFEDKLEKINFNKVEKKDFIDFWQNEYEKDKYYFISFKYKQDLDKIVVLNFSKKPDTEFRVLLDSYELYNYNEKVNGKYLYSKDNTSKFDNFLIKKFERGDKNSEVFEWGGILRKKEETIIK